MNNIQTRSPFFPNSKSARNARNAGQIPALKRNSLERFQKIQQATSRDAKVDIPEAVRDFSRIKRAVDAAPTIDNSAKIANLKSQIQNGTYKIDYDALADKMLTQEF